MNWLNPWVSRAGVVSRVGITPPSLPGGPCITRFRLDGHAMHYLGKPVLLCDGDRAIVVGWQHKGELHACFLAVPDWGWYYRRHSAVSDFVGGILLLFLAALLLVKVAVLPGVLLAGIAAMPIFHAVAWLEGERLMRRVTLASYQPRLGS
ncbi:hypothetical protein HRV97_16975 [Sphingomonas sp. HHU CXW]|uniref:Uncharacterized protein n=1 Tax=Sphingomonas hominis TaxID=2741495 RepID=A0ABX2JSS7_9SPHN|nr:hypothetical protein [Sphingomonas hominis]NTS66835.1 hypothetical protein [Sphingomonas hominis]